MIVLENIDMWEPASVHVVTTNGEVKAVNFGNAPYEFVLTMGTGAALEARQYHHNIQYHAAREIMRYGLEYRGFWQYGFLLIKPNFGIFQVKADWRKLASIALIKQSTEDLYQHATANPLKTYRMNYPGIGAGGLSERDVYPIIRELPNNVWVHKMEKRQ